MKDSANPPNDPSQPEQATGSPTSGEPVFLLVGRLRRPHGIKGEIVMEVLTDFPERLRKGTEVYIGTDYRPYVLHSRRQHEEGLLVSFPDYTSREAISPLRNQPVYVSAEDRPPLEEGEYYHHQVLGMRVFAEQGDLLGTLVEILETGSHDVYVIRPERGPEILLPVLESIILDVSLERGEMRVRVPPGILPEP